MELFYRLLCFHNILDENLINKLCDENKKILQSYNKDSHSLDNIVQDLTKIDNEVKKLFNDEKLTVQCFNFLSTYYYNKGKF